MTAARPPARDVSRAVVQLGGAILRVRPPWAHAAFLRSDVYAGRGVPHGDGAPVVLLPAAVAGDWIMPVLSGWLRRIGYRPFPSAISLHVDCSDRTLTRLLPHLDRIADAQGRPLTLLGHSRGGLLARAAAVSRPELVERVVTLASPLADPFAVDNLTLNAAASLARRRFARAGLAGCLTASCACPFGVAFGTPWPTGPDAPRLVSLFTRTDGVVGWQACVTPDGHNVEVRGTHTGLLASRNAYRAVARALAGEFDEPGTTWAEPHEVVPRARRRR
jgi:pimeloyl-ACP methyl ester carboxylesterase